MCVCEGGSAREELILRRWEGSKCRWRVRAVEGGGVFPQLTRKQENRLWMPAADKSKKISESPPGSFNGCHPLGSEGCGREGKN